MIERDAGAVDSATRVLCVVAGADPSDAAQVANALRLSAAKAARDGFTVSPLLVVLERSFAAVAIGAPEVMKVQGGAVFASAEDGVDAGARDDPELLTRRDVAARLRCSVATVKRWDRNGVLERVGDGRVVRYRRDQVDALAGAAS